MVFCTKCGAENPADAKFCHRCGETTFQAPDRTKPSVFLIVTALVLLGLIQAILLFVVPVFGAMFADFGAKLPAPSEALISVSNFWKGWWWVINLGLGVPVIRAFRRTPAQFNRRLVLKIAILVQCLLLVGILIAAFLPIAQLGAVASGVQ